ncbi:aspartyl protease family protein [Parachryseolinea silvisoli]|uniref:aspartyl protease family protein n=1 Tax=Parachryseolinea silvisoli TaxID=2873601 RepID=UPI002265AC8A|nr:aspartyl protease family protein [Parachryseolinea silvisoli]MCD9016310.1 aspartyl protease family protein [Parachryseolinea silvisoli]
MIRNFLVSVLFCYGIFPAAAQNLGFSIVDGQRKVQMPIEIYNNLVVLPVVLNGTLPLKFILDTGVRTAILTQKTFSDILNLPYSRRYTISGPGGEKLVDAYVTNNVTIELPGIMGRGHAMLVLEEDYLQLRNYMGTDVHGILGYELFSRFIVQVDYEKKVLTLTLPEYFRKPRKYQTLPMKIEDTKPYIITPVVLQDGTSFNAKLLMDSGASHGLLLDPTTDSRIQAPAHVISSVIGRGLGGEITGKVGRIRSIEIGSYKLMNAIANFPDPNSYTDTLKTGNIFRNGAVGGEIMSRFSIIFNFPKEEIYLRKNSSFKKGFHYNLSGLILKARGSQLNIFEISEVRKESAADKAGLLAGDVILSINGVMTQYLSLNHVNGFFNSKPRKKIRLEINRRGERMRKEFTLEDQI